MKEPKDFLTRWSRRKLNPAAEADRGRGENAAPAEKSAGDSIAPVQPAPVEEIDLDTLPSLESIVAGTDVRAFLQRGVPAALTRAALRRAWSADPAIRDFVGLSENSWDFNAPDSISGFGPLDPEEVRRLAAQLLDKVDEFTATDHSAAGRNSFNEPASIQHESGNTAPHEMRKDVLDTEDCSAEIRKNCDKEADIVASTNAGTAAQIPAREDDVERDLAPAHRRHGGALPE